MAEALWFVSDRNHNPISNFVGESCDESVRSPADIGVGVVDLKGLGRVESTRLTLPRALSREFARDPQLMGEMIEAIGFAPF